MSIPHSKVLSVTKGFGAVAQLHNNSPSTSQIVNVNISKTNSVSVPQSEPEQSSPPNPYSELHEQEQQQQPVQSQQDNDVKELLQYKDNVIEALSALLKIVESNPLVVNKYIVASVDDLSSLIKLLTNAEEVHIYLSDDVECTCVNSVSFSAVEKIYILKDNDTLNFKYSFPDANKILDDHHVSVKLVQV